MVRVWSAAVLLSTIGGSSPALAGGLKGSLVFPPPPRAGEARPLAHWRIENGVLPIAPPAPEPRRDVVVVLVPDKPPPPPEAGFEPPWVVLEAKPLRLEPRVAVGRTGATFTIKNEDQTPRTFYMKDGESFMPRQPTPPKSSREVKLTVAGEYRIADADNPLVSTTLVVVDTPYYGRSDDRGTFSVDAPDGKYTLKAYHHGAWTTPQPVEVGRTREVAVKLPAQTPAATATAATGQESR